MILPTAWTAAVSRLGHRQRLRDGAFPLAALAQTALSTAPAGPAAPAATGLKPTQQPSAFVQIARDGTVTATINRLLILARGVRRLANDPAKN
jgi:hypothetical protein